jgi:hypothetical protein
MSMKKYEDWKCFKEAGGYNMSASAQSQAVRGLGGSTSANRFSKPIDKTHAPGNPQQSAAVVEKAIVDVFNGNDIQSQKRVLAVIRKLLSKLKVERPDLDQQGM